MLDKELCDDFSFIVLRNIGIHGCGSISRYKLQVFQERRHPGTWQAS
jgi:hypothetical protein